MRGIGKIGAAVIAAGMGVLGIGQMMPAEPPPQPRRRRKFRRPTYAGGRSRTTTHATNGDRECDRRKRQIAAGSLRVENGLLNGPSTQGDKPAT